ncbi:uncharacterized protein LOC117643659 [Thrips palmi]|uniref:Uncharacterized protein LOC117643659 n=1 Tax=Thrips palmi TaxID=161013 RepID=A0A6P8YFQ1_THRPL|nr:uncharacterized protein LOC117643659 [Thrips palmi]
MLAAEQSCCGSEQDIFSSPSDVDMCHGSDAGSIDFSSAVCDLNLGLQAARDLRDGELDQYLTPAAPDNAMDNAMDNAADVAPEAAASTARTEHSWHVPQPSHHHHHHHHMQAEHLLRYHELQPPPSTAVKVERTPSDSYFYPYLPPGQGAPATGAPTDSWWTGCF